MLHLAQPTMSNALAPRLIGPVKQPLRLMQASLNDSVDFVPKEAEQALHISLNEIESVSLMPRLIEELALHAPKVKVHTHQMDRLEIPNALALAPRASAAQIASRANRSRRTGL